MFDWKFQSCFNSDSKSYDNNFTSSKFEPQWHIILWPGEYDVFKHSEDDIDSKKMSLRSIFACYYWVHMRIYWT